MENNKMAKIYRITNLINGSTYIGMTTQSLEERFANHTAKRLGSYMPTYNWIKQYGRENFKIEQIDETFYRHRFIVEKYYIDKELKKSTICINSSNTSDEYKDKMSSITSGKKNGMYGRKGENSVNGQSVYMLNKNGETIKEFKSVRLALEYLGIKGHVGLMKAVKEKKLYHGHYWNKTNKQYA